MKDKSIVDKFTLYRDHFCDNIDIWIKRERERESLRFWGFFSPEKFSHIVYSTVYKRMRYKEEVALYIRVYIY